MTKRALFLVFAMAILAASILPAQSNEVLDAVLGEATLSYANAAYIVGTAAGSFPDTVTPEEAVPQIEQAGLGLQGRGPADPVTLGDFSYMLTRAFKVPGGIMYRILPGPRYATRELSYLGIITGPAKAGMSLSGERALGILEKMLNSKEAAR